MSMEARRGRRGGARSTTRLVDAVCERRGLLKSFAPLLVTSVTRSIVEGTPSTPLSVSSEAVHEYAGMLLVRRPHVHGLPGPGFGFCGQRGVPLFDTCTS